MKVLVEMGSQLTRSGEASTTNCPGGPMILKPNWPALKPGLRIVGGAHPSEPFTQPRPLGRVETARDLVGAASREHAVGERGPVDAGIRVTGLGMRSLHAHVRCVGPGNQLLEKR